MTLQLPYRKVLIPIDFSDDSRRALQYGVRMAAAAGAEVALLTVIDDAFPYPELFAWDRPDEEFYKTLRTQALAHMEGLLADAPAEVRVERLVVAGRPKLEIVAVAAEIGADLVVLARHGVSGLRTALMGSTTESVLRTAPCPVLVLPPPDQDPGEAAEPRERR
ncbi:MAG TPA: universal stress protein [Thermoanaerobaculia bacterium]|nr:universal stress protein [Thermoanaerobaculia bacterium]